MIIKSKKINHDSFIYDNNYLETGKILGANICRWANFRCFFQKEDSPISIFFLNDSPKFYSTTLFYVKNCQNNILNNIKSLEI